MKMFALKMTGKYQPKHPNSTIVGPTIDVDGFVSKRKNFVWSFVDDAQHGAKLWKHRKGAEILRNELLGFQFEGEVVEIEVHDGI